MAYFAHAFQKKFVATKASNATAGIDMGFLDKDDVMIYNLKNSPYGPGVVGIFDYKTNKSISSTTGLDGGKFYIAASSLMTKDKIGKFHGGYQIENKSKFINPHYINNAWKVTANDAVAPKKGIGVDWVDGTLTVQTDKHFYCGETYYLRIDVKGSPAMRFARHNLYRTFQADGGCCTGETITEVNKAVIYKQWANFINNDPMLQDFVKAYIIIDGHTYSADAEAAALVGADATKLINADTFPLTGTSVYMTILGAYEDTTFGNCSFQPTDYYELEPLRIYASEVDLNGDPCEFGSLDVCDICLGVQANGIGEQKLREVLLHEKYLMNHVANDPRVREITGGDDIMGSINRFGKYDSLYLLHSVPRKSNSDSLLDNDQYLLEVIFEHPSTGSNTGMAKMEGMLAELINEECPDIEIVVGGTASEPTYSFVDYSSQAADDCTYTFPA